MSWAPGRTQRLTHPGHPTLGGRGSEDLGSGPAGGSPAETGIWTPPRMAFLSITLRANPFPGLSSQEGCQVPPLTTTEGSGQPPSAEATPRSLWAAKGLGLLTCTDTAPLGARAESEQRHQVDRKGTDQGTNQGAPQLEEGWAHGSHR